MIKKPLSFVICILFMASVSVPVLAAELPLIQTQNYIITPQYDHINNATSSLTISSSGKATIKGFVQKTKSGKNIYLRSTLQRYKNNSWDDIKSWSESSTSSTASISEKYTVSKGKYRVETYYSVDDGESGIETGTVYSKTVSY